mmetsp:Transcript_4206/g.6023  ORF Transcript_4206/g.6023 Transcript_4206/m.6023 type:complete len:119 (+) Transcript_4206:166-522(+)
MRHLQENLTEVSKPSTPHQTSASCLAAIRASGGIPLLLTHRIDARFGKSPSLQHLVFLASVKAEGQGLRVEDLGQGTGSQSLPSVYQHLLLHANGSRLKISVPMRYRPMVNRNLTQSN